MRVGVVLLNLAVGVAWAWAQPAATQPAARPPRPRVDPAKVMPRLGGPPPVLYGPRLGLLIESALPAPAVAPPKRHRAVVRIVLDEKGAITVGDLATPSGSPGFDATVLTTLKAFGPTAKRTLPLPTDAKLRRQVTTAGVEVPVRERAPVKKLPPGVLKPMAPARLKTTEVPANVRLMDALKAAPQTPTPTPDAPKKPKEP